LERAHGELLREDPVVARQILGSVLGVKIPQRTIDDLVTETIAGDPVLRREWAGARLQDIKRNGRSELDTVGEGLELVISVVRELEKGAWPRVVSECCDVRRAEGDAAGVGRCVERRVSGSRKRHHRRPD